MVLAKGLVFTAGASLLAALLPAPPLAADAPLRLANGIFDDSPSQPASAPAARGPAVPAATPAVPAPPGPASQPTAVPATEPTVPVPVEPIPATAPSPTRPRVIKRQVEPSTASQAAAKRSVDEVFRDRVAAAKKPAQKLALSEALLAAGEQEQPDPAAVFVMLKMAADSAADAGDLAAACKGFDALSERFWVDTFSVEAQAAQRILKLASDEAARRKLIDDASTLVDASATAERFDVALPLNALQIRVASSLGDSELSRRLVARKQSLSDQNTAFAAVVAARAVLARKPGDPDANLLVGKYLCLSEHDWPHGLLYLLHGSDAALKDLAAVELAAPSDNANQIKLGDGWWLAAEKEKGDAREQMLAHAGAWYAKAQPDAVGLVKLRIDKRLAALTSTTTTGSPRAPDAATAQVRRDAITNTATVPLTQLIYSGNQQISPGDKPYALDGTITVRGNTNITVGGGTEIRGGTFDLGMTGHLITTGLGGKPVIFRGVKFVQDLGASVSATGAVFEDCDFTKGGTYYSAYSSKWQLTSSILCNCRFTGLSDKDYGFQIKKCALISMTFPEITHQRRRGFNEVTALHSEWNRIVGCDFVDCTLPPTVFWCAEASNFRGCEFIPGERFESNAPWDDLAFVMGTVGALPPGAWAINPPKQAPVRLIYARGPFPTFSARGIEAIIPELILTGDAVTAVLNPHLKKPD